MNPGLQQPALPGVMLPPVVAPRSSDLLRPPYVGGLGLRAAHLFGRPSSCNYIDWFRGTNTTFTHTGRTAIERARRFLDLRPGDEVLAPAYHCGSEIDVFLNAGAALRLFRVTSAAEIDLEDVQKRITSRTRAIYVIHY